MFVGKSSVYSSTLMSDHPMRRRLDASPRPDIPITFKDCLRDPSCLHKTSKMFQVCFVESTSGGSLKTKSSKSSAISPMVAMAHFLCVEIYSHPNWTKLCHSNMPHQQKHQTKTKNGTLAPSIVIIWMCISQS